MDQRLPEPAATDWRELCAELLADYEQHLYRSVLADRARTALARWGHQPAPPAEGEVAELAAELRMMASQAAEACQFTDAESLSRAADLLERLATACAICERERLHQSTRAADLEVERQAAPVPVLPEGTQVIEPTERTILVPVPVPMPVSERLPGAEDCDSHGWCWVLYSGYSTWTLEPPYGQDGMPTGWTHWLPANALPLPGGEVEHG